MFRSWGCAVLELEAPAVVTTLNDGALLNKKLLASLLDGFADISRSGPLKREIAAMISSGPKEALLYDVQSHQ